MHRSILVLLLLICLVKAAPPSAVAQTLSRPARGSLAGPLDNHIDWMAYHDSGWRAMDKGYYDTAQREFTAAIQVARRPTLNDARLLARSYSSLAWALQKQGRTAEAEPLARWALETRLAHFNPDAEPVARSLNQVATIELQLGRFPAAEPRLRRVLEMKSTGEDTILQEKAQSASLLGIGLASQQRFVEAEKAFTMAVDLGEDLMGPAHPEIGDQLGNLGWVQLEQGKLAEARKSLDRAFKVISRTRGDFDPTTARALEGLARVDVDQHDFGAAEARYRRLATLYEQPAAPQSGPRREALSHLAEVLDKSGRPDEAGRTRAQIDSPPPGRSTSPARVGPGPVPRATTPTATPTSPSPGAVRVAR